MPRPSRRDPRGFTMIELIVTMIVVGILAVFVSGRMNFSGDFEERAVADKLKAGLQFARKSAVAKRRYVCVSVAGGTVSFLYDGNEPEAATRNCATTNYLILPSRDGDCTGGNGNQICSKTNVTIGGSAFNFDAQGRASGAASFTVTAGASSTTVTIEAETGYVH